MGTLKEKLEYIADTKDAIKDAIEAKGVTVASTATFRSYADSINSIISNSITIHIVDDEYNIIDAVSSQFDHIYIFSDTLFKDDLSLSDCTYNNNIVTNFNFINNNLIKLTLNTTNLIVGNDFTFTFNEGSFKFNNNDMSITYPIQNTLEMFLNTNLGYVDVMNAGMNQYNQYLFLDSGDNTISLSSPIKSLPARVQDVINNSGYSSININYDDYITLGSHKIYFQYRDNSTHLIQKAVCLLDNGSYLVKIKQQSIAPYTGSSYDINIDYEIYFFSNGDFEIHSKKNGYTGSDGRNEISFFDTYQTSYGAYKISLSGMGNNSYKSFYAKDFGKSDYTIINEPYDITHHILQSDNALITGLTLTESLGNEDYLMFMRYINDNSYNYDYSWTYGKTNYGNFTWHYNGTDYDTFYVCTDSYFGLNSSSNQIAIGNDNGDKQNKYIKYGLYSFTLNNTTIKALKIRWVGSNQFNTNTENLNYELYFFDNGDAMIYDLTGNTTTSHNNFLGNSFSTAQNACTSFYRNNVEGTSWTIINEQYDISHHLI